MSLYIDLLKDSPHQKKLFKFIGTGWGIIAVSWIIVKLYERTPFRLFDWFYVSFMMLYFIVFMARIIKPDIFGKAFVRIDENVISMKISPNAKEYNIPWAQVSKLLYRVTFLDIFLVDGSSVSIDLTNVGYENIQKIKVVIQQVCRAKGILLSL